MLKQSLAANFLFSAASGSGILLFSEQLSGEIAAPGWFWALLGIGLLAFAVQLGAMLLLPRLMRALILQVVFADIAWVLLTSVALLLFLDDITRLGVTMILAVNLAVAALALLQFLGYRATS